MNHLFVLNVVLFWWSMYAALGLMSKPSNLATTVEICMKTVSNLPVLSFRNNSYSPNNHCTTGIMLLTCSLLKLVSKALGDWLAWNKNEVRGILCSVMAQASLAQTWVGPARKIIYCEYLLWIFSSVLSCIFLWCTRKRELSALFLKKPGERGSVAVRWLAMRAKK